MAKEKKNKILNFFGYGDEEEYDDDEYFDDEEDEVEVNPRSKRYDERNEGFFRRSKKPRVVSVQERAKSSVIIFSPKTYADAQPLVMHLIQNKHVIVKLDKVERPVAQRILDFMSGAAYACDAQVSEVSKGSIYLFASNQTFIDQSQELDTPSREGSGFIVNDDQF